MTQVVARRHAPGFRAAGVVLFLLAVGAACGGRSNDSDADSGDPSPPVRTTALPAPSDPPPSGGLAAEMRQSSIDVALGRMQVWIANDTRLDTRPENVTYDDPRLPAPLDVDPARLRTIPAGSERGFPLVLPRRIDCDRPESSHARAEGSGRVDVRTPRITRRVRVSDETDVVGRFVSQRCAEQRLADVAELRWADAVTADRPGPGSPGVLSLLVRPTGTPGHTLRIDTVAGSHLLGSADEEPVWKPGLMVRSDGPPARVRLPLRPTRCDGHAFAEGGGATAFHVRFRLDGEPGELVLRMGEAGRRAALEYARTSCGLD